MSWPIVGSILGTQLAESNKMKLPSGLEPNRLNVANSSPRNVSVCL